MVESWQGTHSTKTGAGKSAEDTPNAHQIFGPICMPKRKSLEFLKKKLSLGVSVVRAAVFFTIKASFTHIYSQEEPSLTWLFWETNWADFFLT